MSGQGTENKEEMQTVVSSYATPNLIEQADNRLIENFQNENYINCYDEKSPDEKINVDGEDREEELVITDDIIVDDDKESQAVQESKEEKNVLRKEESFEPSWHPHVYGKPPKKPTPHSIEYILGLNQRKIEEPRRSQLINVKRNFETKKFCFEKSIQVQTDVTDKKFSLSVHKNKLQEQLLQRGVRTSDSEGDKVYAFRGEEQPLNLSVPKSKDSGWSSTDEDKICKGEFKNNAIINF